MRRALVIAGLATALVLPAVPALQQAARGASFAWCGRNDLPETGIQGDVPRADQLSGRAMQGYNCGVSLVGHSDLGGRGGNANMAWAGNCAYVAGAGNGIAVVDVSDPRHPRHVRTLHGEGSDFTLETLAASRVGGRAVLVAGRYGPAPLPVAAPVDIYDATDCANPRRTATFVFPQNVHNLTISPDTRRVYATMPLQAIDITDLARPRYLGNLDEVIPAPTPGKYLGHEAVVAPDNRTLYLGGQLPTYELFTIVDLAGWPTTKPKVLSQVKGRGHSIRLATVGGRRYVLHSEESIVDPAAKGCVPQEANPFTGAAQPWMSDVTDPTRPVMRVGQFRLEINEPQNCPAQAASGVNASVHYHDVDNPDRTTFAMLSMWNAGVRIVDVRNPRRMREVGYFNPGAFRTEGGAVTLDKAWGHIRYVPETGHIWFATETGGFWVVELEPQVRRSLGLPPRPSVSPHGAPARPASTVSLPVALAAVRADTTAWYCTLGAARAASAR